MAYRLLVCNIKSCKLQVAGCSETCAAKRVGQHWPAPETPTTYPPGCVGTNSIVESDVCAIHLNDCGGVGICARQLQCEHCQRHHQQHRLLAASEHGDVAAHILLCAPAQQSHALHDRCCNSPRLVGTVGEAGPPNRMRWLQAKRHSLRMPIDLWTSILPSLVDVACLCLAECIFSNPMSR